MSRNPLIFNYETSLRTDFQNGQIKPLIKTVSEPKPRNTILSNGPKPIRANDKSVRMKNIESLAEWRVPPNCIPLELLTKPKEIIRTDPRNVQKRFVKSPDLDLEEVRKTRPKLVMVPAVCMDDIDPEPLDILIKDIYTSATMRTQREGCFKTNNVISALPGTLAPAKPITLRNSAIPYVSPEWRMDSVTWDSRKLRVFCDPHKLFWSRRTPKCSACDSTADRNRRVGRLQ